MANICPLLVRASFIGRTYHDFQLEFVSPERNCSTDPEQNPLLIQFTRLLNSTSNDTSYVLYDPSNPRDALPSLQVFHDDHVALCIRSPLDTGTNATTCHEFYMVTMLSSINTTFWPLLIICSYIIVLLIAILVSLFAQCLAKYLPSLFSYYLIEKLSKTHNIRLLIPLTQQNLHNNRITNLNEKNEVLNAIDLIAKECRPNTHTFIIHTENKRGHSNRGYI